MNKIQRFFLDFKNKKYKGENAPLRTNINYNQAKSVGILFTTENLESIEALSNFIKHLQQDGKQVKALTYQNTKNKESNLKSVNFNHHVVTEKDISLLGEVKSFLVDDFVKAEFDYLFCVTLKPLEVFEDILLKSRAKCRVGKFIEDANNLELMIKLNDNEGTDVLIQQMYYYVKTIKND